MTYSGTRDGVNELGEVLERGTHRVEQVTGDYVRGAGDGWNSKVGD